jgi:hypothetical protein
MWQSKKPLVNQFGTPLKTQLFGTERLLHQVSIFKKMRLLNSKDDLKNLGSFNDGVIWRIHTVDVHHK